MRAGGEIGEKILHEKSFYTESTNIILITNGVLTRFVPMEQGQVLTRT